MPDFSWKQKLDLEKGNVGVVYSPEDNIAFIVFGCPSNAQFLTFEGAIIFKKWADKNKIQIVKFEIPEKRAAPGSMMPMIPPELLLGPPMEPSIKTIDQLEGDMNAQLELLRKKRLQDIKDGDGEKKEDKQPPSDGMAS
jgi:hypothetical protein